MENNTNKLNISNETQPLFIDINPDNPVNEIESLCMNCKKNGTTRLLMTKIPFFKEIIIMSFSCPHCGFRSNEIEPAEGLAPQGIHFELNVQTSKDMNRRVIKSNFATLNIPCCDLEIPQSTQKGKLSTVEGFINTAKENFSASLEDGYYNEMGDEFINKIKEIIKKLSDTLNGKMFPFLFILDDPSGNSFVENPYAPQTDPNIKVSFFERTKEMAESMGYSIENQKIENDKSDNKNVINEKNNNIINSDEAKKKDEHSKISYYNKKKDFTVYKSKSNISNYLVNFTDGIDDSNSDIDKKLFVFPEKCICCGSNGNLRNCICTIPYFKELIISCFKCDNCDYKTTDIKGGGGISEKATKLTLKVLNKEDLNRDIFKSETSKIIIPEIGFETSDSSMGSMFTTVEGILDKICTTLQETPFGTGDSRNNEKINEFIMKIRDLQQLNKKFTLIIDDPLSNSFIFPLGEMEKDTQLMKEEYDRTYEQNEELGINDMKVENYEKKDNENKKDEKNEEKK